MSTVKLKRLKINQYRNVRPGTELHFDDGVNLVLGQNGSGKTTLLGLLAMVCGWYFAELEDEEFSIEFELRQDAQRFHFRLSNRRTVPDASEPALETFSYDYQLSLDDPELHLRGTPTSLTFTRAASETSKPPCSPYKHDFLLHLASALPVAAVAGSMLQYHDLRRKLWMLRPGTPYRFDEGLGCFHALTGESAPAIGPVSPSAASVGSTVIVDRTSSSPSVIPSGNQSPFATSVAVLQQIFAGTDPSWSIFDSVPCDKIDFLSTAVTHLGFASATLRLAGADASGSPKLRKLQIAGFHFQFSSNDSRRLVPHQHLSYGQKRLLAFFYYLANNDTFIVADELVNGLHHRWIDACMKAIGERQAFLTSQNPLLFDYVEFDSIEQVQARFITCKSELVDGAEQLIWENMPRDDAARFYEAYTDEIEQVGEILITRGLW